MNKNSFSPLLVEHMQQEFELHPLGAVYWSDSNALLLADTHFGKASHFQKNGIALPTQPLFQELENLQFLIDYYPCEKVYILGDLFHSDINEEWAIIEAFFNSQSIDIILILGNHDKIPSFYLERTDLKVYDQLRVNNILLRHHPLSSKAVENHICGHIHPAVSMRGYGRQRLKLPCFFLPTHQLMLPSFGLLTGTHTIKPKAGESVYVIADDSVIKV